MRFKPQSATGVASGQVSGTRYGSYTPTLLSSTQTIIILFEYGGYSRVPIPLEGG